mgnify:CR=1 FL=1
MDALGLPSQSTDALGQTTQISRDALAEARAVIVRVEPEAWLRLRPADAAAALAVGYHAGNLHWRVRFEGEDRSSKVLDDQEYDGDIFKQLKCLEKVDQHLRTVGR